MAEKSSTKSPQKEKKIIKRGIILWMNIEGNRSKIECVTHNVQHRPHTGKCIIRLVGKSSIKMMYHTNLTTCAQKNMAKKKRKIK